MPTHVAVLDTEQLTNYYTWLGVSPTASRTEIKEAFRRRAFATHPDQGGNEDEFRRVQEAYTALSTLSTLDDLLANPSDYDHYQFLNALLKLEGNQQLTTGQALSFEEKDKLWRKMSYLGHLLAQELRPLRRLERRKPTKAGQERLAFLTRNSNKMGDVITVLLSDDNKAKNLYDLTLPIELSQEQRELKAKLGGQEALKAYLKDDPHLNGACGIYALLAANQLNPANLDKLRRCGKNITNVSLILRRLARVNTQLVTQANFDLVLQHQRHANGISKGLSRLEQGGLLNQTNFEAVVNSGAVAETLGISLKALQKAGLLNDMNWQLAVHQLPHFDFFQPLHQLQLANLLTPADAEAMQWQAPAELATLAQDLDKLITYGLYLLSRDEDVGKATLLTGLALKKDLKAFFELEPTEQEATKQQFKARFMETLQAKHIEMGEHRAHWKVITANVVISLTGVGLFALGIHYLATGHCFFGQTKRQQFVEKAESSSWLAAEPQATMVH